MAGDHDSIIPLAAADPILEAFDVGPGCRVYGPVAPGGRIPAERCR